MQTSLIAYAEDCVLRGDVDLGDGRLSDAVNEQELMTFRSATLEAFDDGHRVEMAELEVARRDLHVIELEGRRGDPGRRLRTVAERVELEIGPFFVTGNLHRPPNTQPLAALSRWAKFVPLTDAVFRVGEDAREHHREALLVNRERIAKIIPLRDMPSATDDGGGMAPAG